MRYHILQTVAMLYANANTKKKHIYVNKIRTKLTGKQDELPFYVEKPSSEAFEQWMKEEEARMGRINDRDVNGLDNHYKPC